MTTSLMIRTVSIQPSFGQVFLRAFSDSVVSIRARRLSYAEMLAAAIIALEDSISGSSPSIDSTPNTPYTPATSMLPPTPSSPKKRGAYPEARRPGSPPKLLLDPNYLRNITPSYYLPTGAFSPGGYKKKAPKSKTTTEKSPDMPFASFHPDQAYGPYPDCNDDIYPISQETAEYGDIRAEEQQWGNPSTGYNTYQYHSQYLQATSVEESLAFASYFGDLPEFPEYSGWTYNWFNNQESEATSSASSSTFSSLSSTNTSITTPPSSVCDEELTASLYKCAPAGRFDLVVRKDSLTKRHLASLRGLDDDEVDEAERTDARSRVDAFVRSMLERDFDSEE